MNDVLNLRGVSKTYFKGEQNELVVLEAANLSVKEGEVVALVAPSGAGKSTLLHIAGLLDTPDDGFVSIGGEDLTNRSDRKRTAVRREDIGFVYQFHHLLPEFSAAENLMLPQMANGLSQQRAQKRAGELLAWVNLADRANHRPGELSGGEQQRVAFCRAMANAPKLLIADEPTGNLDPATSEHVFTTLMKLVRETKMAALIATHNLELAERMDRQVSLRAGKLVEV